MRVHGSAARLNEAALQRNVVAFAETVSRDLVDRQTRVNLLIIRRHHRLVCHVISVVDLQID